MPGGLTSSLAPRERSSVYLPPRMRRRVATSAGRWQGYRMRMETDGGICWSVRRMRIQERAPRMRGELTSSLGLLAPFCERYRLQTLRLSAASASPFPASQTPTGMVEVICSSAPTSKTLVQARLTQGDPTSTAGPQARFSKRSVLQAKSPSVGSGLPCRAYLILMGIAGATSLLGRHLRTPARALTTLAVYISFPVLPVHFYGSSIRLTRKQVGGSVMLSLASATPPVTAGVTFSSGRPLRILV